MKRSPNRKDTRHEHIRTEAATPSAADVADETIIWAVGGGIMTTALFPFAMPMLALTAVWALPLLLPLLAVGLAAAVVVLPVLAVRGLVRLVVAALSI